MNEIIKIDNLTKYYGDSKGIEKVNLSIKKGEIFGFIGPNGAGKSTAIRTILGLLIPTSGNSQIFGLDSQKHSIEIRQKIGYLPSEVNYYDEMSSRELLEYSAKFYTKNGQSKIEEYAEYFELDLNKKITDLSFGNKKKCAIIQSIIHEPELLILDEPTSGLDPLMQNRFFDLLEQKNKKGATIFFSSHILSEIQRMCDKAAVIRNGEIIAEENIADLLKKQMKKIRLVFENKPESETLIEGANHIKWHQNKVEFDFKGPINNLLVWLNNQKVSDLVIEEPDLESIFMNYYER